MNTTPCGLEDDRVRFEPEAVEEESHLTDMEKRIEWICSDWSDAITNDSFDEWFGMRNSIHGAVQTLIYCKDRHEDISAMNALQEIAFQHCLNCIHENKYEGAPV